MPTFCSVLKFQRPKTTESEIPHRTKLTQFLLIKAQEVSLKLHDEFKVSISFLHLLFVRYLRFTYSIRASFLLHLTDGLRLREFRISRSLCITSTSTPRIQQTGHCGHIFLGFLRSIVVIAVQTQLQRLCASKYELCSKVCLVMLACFYSRLHSLSSDMILQIMPPQMIHACVR